ncbi:MAG: hypothetical protein Q8M66_07925 [Actinomycetota bacterium]|nr:hypothetical protein [Actinomycetota bacterium]MDZ4178609.1 hypothetical protein [Coriobacteriia bacterium]
MTDRLVEPAVVDALDYLITMYRSVHTNDRRNTPAGHWINEAYVIRLCAVLECHHVFDDTKKIDFSLPGADEVDLCRRLRNEFAHATGSIHDGEAVKLDQRVREAFGLGNQTSIFEGKFILSKDTVLGPMTSACLKYCVALMSREAAAG